MFCVPGGKDFISFASETTGISFELIYKQWLSQVVGLIGTAIDGVQSLISLDITKGKKHFSRKEYVHVLLRTLNQIVHPLITWIQMYRMSVLRKEE